MHIALDLDLQKLNSQVTKNIEPEEKDWFLNAETHKYILSKTRPDTNKKRIGFQDTTKRIEDIKDLVKEKPLHLLGNTSEDRYANLSSDFFDFVRFDCKIAKDCESPLRLLTNTTYRTVFNLKLPEVGTLSTYLIKIKIGTVTTTLFDIEADLPSNYLVNENFFKQKFLLEKALRIKLQSKIEEVLGSKVELYWERYNTEFRPSTFTLVSSTEMVSITVEVNSDVFINNTEIINSTVYREQDLQLLSPIRVIDDEYYGKVIGSSLSKSRMASLTGVLRQSIIKVKLPKGVIGGVVLSTYICKPSIIDLNLNSSLNVSRKVCEEIVRNTAQFIKMLISDDNYSAYVQENMITE